MLQSIEKLLILQDRDKQIAKTSAELERIEPERAMLNAKAVATQGILDTAKHRVKQIESDRKKLELDVEAKKQLIEKYANQQFQTKKNEEYRALAHEIENCKAFISKLDDQQIELMEKAELAQKDVSVATLSANEARKLVEGQISNLAGRETTLTKQLEELRSNRESLLSNVEDAAKSKYERLLKTKGATAIVGIQHGVCGGCHMRLPTQIIVTCQGHQEIVTCINCGRILYFTPDMDMMVAD
jgi:predicted  nucleic acid-binding Zn-ribbon protein